MVTLPPELRGNGSTEEEAHPRPEVSDLPGTCSGTGTGYRPTALPTVVPYGPPVPEQVPGLSSTEKQPHPRPEVADLPDVGFAEHVDYERQH